MAQDKNDLFFLFMVGFRMNNSLFESDENAVYRYGGRAVPCHMAKLSHWNIIIGFICVLLRVNV